MDNNALSFSFCLVRMNCYHDDTIADLLLAMEMGPAGAADAATTANGEVTTNGENVNKVHYNNII